MVSLVLDEPEVDRVLLSGKLGCAIFLPQIKTRYCRMDARLYTSKVPFQAFFRVSTLRYALNSRRFYAFN